MTSVALKRITKDLRDLQKDSLEGCGIYYYHDDVDILRGRALIIGPEDTPYRYGNYFFDFYFPEEYPYVPPKVVFQTREGNIRFNPNLYACGKVCVSILNTWSGPQWTACQSIRSVLLSLQSLLNEHPLQNEPGFENDVGERSQNYENVIKHENMRFAILEMTRQIRPGFDGFRDCVRSNFMKNITQILKWCLSEKLNNPPKMIRTSIYGMRIVSNWSDLIRQCLKIALKVGITDVGIDGLDLKTYTKSESRLKRKNGPKKIIISKNPWKSLSITDMMQKKTVVLIKSHIIQKKISPQNVIATMRKQDLCTLVWNFYHNDETDQDVKHITKKIKVSKISKGVGKETEKEAGKEVGKVNKIYGKEGSSKISQDIDSKEEVNKQIKIKKTPSQPAKTYPLGQIIQSNNSNLYYKVSQRKDGVYFWKRVNGPQTMIV